MMNQPSHTSNLKIKLQAPGNKPAQGKVLETYLSSLRQERVRRAGALVCLTARSNQIEGFQLEWYISTICHCGDIPFWSETLEIWSDPLPGRGK